MAKAGGVTKTEVIFEGRVIVVMNETSDVIPANAGATTNSDSSSNVAQVLGPSPITNNASSYGSSTSSIKLLIQMHGGLWSLCMDLSGN